MENTKLKGILREKKYTYKDICTKIDMSVTTFNKKINDGKFTVLEAKAISKELRLTPEESTDIFLK